MKKLRLWAIPAILTLLTISACKDEPTLTTQQAQKAVDVAMADISKRWKGPPGTAQVQGVQINPDGAGAQADLVFSNISITCTGFGIAPETNVWQRGQAAFKHYTDDRWVLMQVHFDGEELSSCSHGWTGSVLVR